MKTIKIRLTESEVRDLAMHISAWDYDKTIVGEKIMRQFVEHERKKEYLTEEEFEALEEHESFFPMKPLVKSGMIKLVNAYNKLYKKDAI